MAGFSTALLAGARAASLRMTDLWRAGQEGGGVGEAAEFGVVGAGEPGFELGGGRGLRGGAGRARRESWCDVDTSAESPG